MGGGKCRQLRTFRLMPLWAIASREVLALILHLRELVAFSTASRLRAAAGRLSGTRRFAF